MNIKKFRKKPVVVEAVQLTKENLYQIRDWSGSHEALHLPDPETDKSGTLSFTAYVVGLDMKTSDGEFFRADFGDWIIKTPTGEFYPCKPGVFDAIYEEVKTDE